MKTLIRPFMYIENKITSIHSLKFKCEFFTKKFYQMFYIEFPVN